MSEKVTEQEERDLIEQMIRDGEEEELVAFEEYALIYDEQEFARRIKKLNGYIEGLTHLRNTHIDKLNHIQYHSFKIEGIDLENLYSHDIKRYNTMIAKYKNRLVELKELAERFKFLADIKYQAQKRMEKLTTNKHYLERLQHDYFRV
jgi:hypothetical protein